MEKNGQLQYVDEDGNHKMVKSAADNEVDDIVALVITNTDSDAEANIDDE